MSPDVRLDRLAPDDFAAIEALACTIWHEYYPAIIPVAQIDYMLTHKYAPEQLAPFVDGPDRWFEVLRVNGEMAGFVRCLRESKREFKLMEIYLLQACRGRGLGRLMLDRADQLASAAGCSVITLTVNRANTSAIATYRRAGYGIKQACNFDIGHGFVMNDYVMEKRFDDVAST